MALSHRSLDRSSDALNGDEVARTQPPTPSALAARPSTNASPHSTATPAQSLSGLRRCHHIARAAAAPTPSMPCVANAHGVERARVAPAHSCAAATAPLITAASASSSAGSCSAAPSAPEPRLIARTQPKSAARRVLPESRPRSRLGLLPPRSSDASTILVASRISGTSVARPPRGCRGQTEYTCLLQAGSVVGRSAGLDAGGAAADGAAFGATGRSSKVASTPEWSLTHTGGASGLPGKACGKSSASRASATAQLRPHAGESPVAASTKSSLQFSS
mmetsp:Transcript_3301/g.13583  ORF Transcript_3301/g.13583 Transcript_3301/m.13583 type:complete len:277 (+) Transcript_3301:573-1403(+)